MAAMDNNLGNGHEEGRNEDPQRTHFHMPDRSQTYPAGSSGGSDDQQDAVVRHRKQHSLDAHGTRQQERDGDASISPSKDGSRKKRGAQSRVCGKCGQPLLGQFVRALGDTYHLECFTCTVSDRQSRRSATTNQHDRTAARLLLPNSSRYPNNRQTNTLSARPITSEDLTCCARPAAARFEDRTSLHSSANTILSTLRVPSARPCSVRKTHTTNTKETCFAITTIRQNSLRDAMAARRLS